MFSEFHFKPEKVSLRIFTRRRFRNRPKKARFVVFGVETHYIKWQWWTSASLIFMSSAISTMLCNETAQHLLYEVRQLSCSYDYPVLVVTIMYHYFLWAIQ